MHLSPISVRSGSTWSIDPHVGRKAERSHRADNFGQLRSRLDVWNGRLYKGDLLLENATGCAIVVADIRGLHIQLGQFEATISRAFATADRPRSDQSAEVFLIRG